VHAVKDLDNSKKRRGFQTPFSHCRIGALPAVLLRKDEGIRHGFFVDLIASRQKEITGLSDKDYSTKPSAPGEKPKSAKTAQAPADLHPPVPQQPRCLTARPS